jgi:methylmalonyl-CoA mutase
VLDPWGGSYYVEALTNELMKRAWGHIQEVESLGGMAKAIESGLPKMRIEEAAARRNRRISTPARKPSSASTSTGCPRKTRSKSWKSTIRRCVNRRSQRLQKLRANRDEAKVKASA